MNFLRFLPLVLVCLCCSVLSAADVHFLDLGPYTNQKRSDNLGRGVEGNHLTALPGGEQTFQQIKFHIGDGLIQLGSKVLRQMPEKVEGIPVDRTATKIHFLHATGFGGGPNKTEADALFVKDDALIGEYVVRYDDGSSEGILIVYGKDVRDWWFREDEPGVTRGKVAWTGDNPWAMANDCRIRLYTTTWENPKPKIRISGIDYVGRKNDTIAAPFCVAITVQSD